MIKNNIKPQHFRWYIGWCQQFVQFLGQHPLNDCQPEQVSAFLDNLQNHETIKDWQWSQARNALWHLFRDHLQLAWAVGKTTPRPTETEKLAVEPLSPAHQETLRKMRSTLVGRQYAKRTQKAYLGWATRFLAYYPQRKIIDLDENSIKAYLTALAEELSVAVNTQKQALNALVYLFQVSEGRELGDFSDFSRARKPIKVPVVLSRDEVSVLLSCLNPPHLLVCRLLYGAGLRLMEAIRLRIKDIDFANNQILVRDGKGRKDRVALLPAICYEPFAGTDQPGAARPR